MAAICRLALVFCVLHRIVSTLSLSPTSCSSAAWGACQPSPYSGSCLDHLNYGLNTEGKSCQDALNEIHTQCGACSICSTSDCPTPIPSKYYPHFDASPDTLGIAAVAAGINGNPGSISDNFYLVVGDQGGCDGGCSDCCGMQRQVAAKMKDYVQKRKLANPNATLLFVLAVGDNFYWTGASEGRFSGTWLDVYDEELTNVPWFAVMGNHDYGNSDPGSACPSVSPRFVCNSNNSKTAACGGDRPYSTEPQGYNSNQLDANKGGVDGELRANWHMPDYTYFYTIPELDFELVALDWNWYDRNSLGGDSSGSSEVRNVCGSTDRLSQSLESLRDASTDLLNARAKAAESSNVAIISHYGERWQDNQNLRNMYLDALPKGSQGKAKVFNFYGHDHAQKCDKTEGNECVDFLTGGSGGCCSTSDLPAGFVAIHFDDTRKQVVGCFTDDDCTLNSYARWQSMAEEDNLEKDVCPYTNDDPQCPNYNGPAHEPLLSVARRVTSTFVSLVILVPAMVLATMLVV